ncbi:AAA family ATPase [Blastococcus deserti]|uniref:AAA family ATPase n=1 Tax=Blastococcus deserti TaxID=2259033 RepID=A0ABW4XF09_9ACTN
MVVTAVAPRPQPRAGDRDAVLVVIGGLPGSGKTTLLRRLLAERVPGVTGLDSEQVTARVRRAGIGLPYRLLRPFVHSWHRWRVLRGIGGPAPVVVLTDPWTSAPWRTVVLCVARAAGRSVRLVLLDASPEEARDGQTARGRAISARALRRHAKRWHRLLRSMRSRHGQHAVVVDRPRADRLTLGELVDLPVSGRTPRSR